jgi:hypothetical protein
LEDARETARLPAAGRLSLAAAGAVLVYFLALKLRLFEALEYLGDVFSALQMSRGFAEGRPLLWENGYGPMAGLHGYYLLPFLWPLTSWLGARGLFVVHVGLLGAAAARIGAYGRRIGPPRSTLAAAVAAAFLLGPISFWMLDDPPQGWNADLLFLPLGILFGLDLLEGRRRAALWGALLVLCREEGAVVAWAIHALHVLASRAESGRAKRLARVTAGWLALFVLSVAFLAYHARSAPGPSRLSLALAHVAALPREPELLRPLLLGFAGAALMLASGTAVLVAGIPARALPAGAVAALPLAAVHAVSSLYYSGSSIFLSGPSWCPRFAQTWAVLALALLFSLDAPTRPRGRAELRVRAAAAVALSFAAQAGALRAVRSYDALARLSPRNFRAGAALVESRFTERERALLRCLGGALPRRTRVLTNLSLFAPFDRQDEVWPDRPGNAWLDTFPEVTVCDTWGRLLDDGCLRDQAALPASGFAGARVDGLLVRWGTGASGSVGPCLESSVPLR